jgi:ABC-type polysaccharide/polyol phosphate transport system ATPase subunit
MSAAVTVDGVSKRFRLYQERNQSLKATLMRRGRSRYREHWALRDVSVEIPAGTTFGFIGENGSGKSTLLKCIAKILRPEQGQISVEGKVSALLELGAGFHPELSGRENVYLNGSILGLNRKELDRKFDDIVAFAGLERFIDSPVKNYSSGMYVRLGFAVAINVDPDVLLVDEVLAVGDEQFQRKCNEKFFQLKAAGITIVIVTHDLGSVRSLCDVVGWVDDGRLREVGPADEVVDSYLDQVRVGRSDESGQGSRWGSGEVVVERLELLDASGQAVSRTRTGDRVTFRIHYSAGRPVERPVFAMAVHTLEGVELTRPNTRQSGAVIEQVEGAGVVDLTVERLLLLPGTYDASAAVTDYAALHTFDHRHRALRFDVDAGTPHETDGGLVSLGGAWQVRPPASTE